MNYPTDRLRHHVSGAIARGEAEAIEAIEPIGDEYREWNKLPPYELAVWNDQKVEPASPGKVRWSRKDGAPPPPIGARIYANMNDLGPARVVSYVTLDGWLGVNAQLEAAPAWHKRQNKGNPGGCLFGPEFEPLVDHVNVQGKISELVRRKRDAIEKRAKAASDFERRIADERVERLGELIGALSA